MTHTVTVIVTITVTVTVTVTVGVVRNEDLRNHPRLVATCS